MDGPETKRARSQPELTLYYFDFPGMGESLRLAMTYSGLNFDDVRLGRDEFQ